MPPFIITVPVELLQMALPKFEAELEVMSAVLAMDAPLFRYMTPFIIFCDPMIFPVRVIKPLVYMPLIIICFCPNQMIQSHSMLVMNLNRNGSKS